MEHINSTEIAIPSIIAFVINIISAYLFALHTIDINLMMFIIIGSIIVIIIIGIQSKNKNISEKLEKLELSNKKLEEKLKIHEQLVDIKADIKNLQMKTKK